MSKTIYVTIGNSDDKLTQAEWAQFFADVDDVIRGFAATVHGSWHSLPASPWQNACWCFELLPAVGMQEYDADRLKKQLHVLAKHNRQNSIAWAEAQVFFVQGVS